MSHTLGGRCAFCQALTKIWSETVGEDFATVNAAVEKLWDQHDRARLLRRAYGKRKGYQS